MNRLRALGAFLLVLGFAMTLEDVQQAGHRILVGDMPDVMVVEDDLKGVEKVVWNERRDRYEQGDVSEWHYPARPRKTTWGRFDGVFFTGEWEPGSAELIGWASAAIGLALLVGSFGQRQETKGGAA